MTRRMAALILVAAASCYGSDDDPAVDAPPRDCDEVCTTDAQLACPGPGQPGGPSGGCELVVANMSDCPSINEICTPGTCGGAHECCFCQANGTWGTLFTDCEPCVDAGVQP